jgi:hypothetical protein
MTTDDFVVLCLILLGSIVGPAIGVAIFVLEH